MRIDRNDLVEQLELITPGLSKRDMIEQSNSFLFLGDVIATYNDEMMVAVKTDLNIKGAVQAEPLLSLVRKMPDTALEIKATDSSLTIKGRGRRQAKLRLDREVFFNFQEMEKPKKWHQLPENFTDAVSKVHHCAGKDSTQFSLTCVHLNPKWVEAFDNYQVARHSCKLPIKESVLVPAATIQNVTTMEVDRFGLTESWIHFSNESGLIISCRTDRREYPDTSAILKTKGKTIIFPKGLKASTEIAEIFSSSNQDENVVEINIQSGKLLVKGDGAVGYYKEEHKIPYKGPDISFLIPPALIGDLSSRFAECEITDDKLIVRERSWTYVTVLGQSRNSDKQSE